MSKHRALVILTATTTALISLTGLRNIGSVAASPATTAAMARVHIVRGGDTIWAIARMHGLAPATLASANHRADPDRLRVGEQITIPGAGPGPNGPLPTGGAAGLRRLSMLWPSRGVLTSRFGFRDKRHHHGIDIAGPIGSPIIAVGDGVVRFIGWRGGYGRLVILDHGQGVTTWYGHVSKILVKEGQRVTSRKVIALVGATGHVTGPNVHFEVRRNGVPTDPLVYLSDRSPR